MKCSNFKPSVSNIPLFRLPNFCKSEGCTTRRKKTSKLINPTMKPGIKKLHPHSSSTYAAAMYVPKMPPGIFKHNLL